jgi:hypothetical protein
LLPLYQFFGGKVHKICAEFFPELWIDESGLEPTVHGFTWIPKERFSLVRIAEIAIMVVTAD